MFSALHETVHALQPMHFCRSITMTHRRRSSGWESARSRSPIIRSRMLPSNSGPPSGETLGGGAAAAAPGRAERIATAPPAVVRALVKKRRRSVPRPPSQGVVETGPAGGFEQASVMCSPPGLCAPAADEARAQASRICPILTQNLNQQH